MTRTKELVNAMNLVGEESLALQLWGKEFTTEEIFEAVAQFRAQGNDPLKLLVEMRSNGGAK